MANKNDINEFNELIPFFSKTNYDKLIHNDGWGNFNFDECSDHFTRIKLMMDVLSNSNISLLPDDIVHSLRNDFTQIKDIFEQILSSDVQNLASQKNGIVTNIKNLTDSLFKFTAPFLAMLVYSSDNYHHEMHRIKTEINNSLKLYEKALSEMQDVKIRIDSVLSDSVGSAEINKSEIENIKIEINKTLDVAREVAAQAGVAHFSRHFDREAQKLNASAVNWLWATGCLALLTLVAVFLLGWAGVSWYIPAERFLSFTVSKILFVLTLATATLWCGKMYKSTKHLSAINRHRADSLKTFQAFTRAAEGDPETRNAVLLETTRSIFTIAPTGLIEAGDSGEGNLKILEIIKHLGKS